MTCALCIDGLRPPHGAGLTSSPATSRVLCRSMPGDHIGSCNRADAHHVLSWIRALVVVAICGLAPPAVAEPTSKPVYGVIAGHLALGSPVGGVGLEAGIGYSWFQVSVGTGVGFKGHEYAVMARAVSQPLPRSRGMARAWGVGSGVSRGPALTDLDIDRDRSRLRCPDRVDAERSRAARAGDPVLDRASRAIAFGAALRGVRGRRTSRLSCLRASARLTSARWCTTCDADSA